MSQQVWLGLAGDLVVQDDMVDHYSTRVGGCVVLPGRVAPAEALSGCSISCSVCGKKLSLLLQAYAPHPDAPERVVLVLGCTRLGCGKEAGAYTALRCQLPFEPQQQQHLKQAEFEQPAASAATAAASADGCDAFETAADDWGDLGDWGAPTAVGPEEAAADAFDFSDLTESLEAAGLQQQLAAAAGASKQKSKHDDNRSRAICCRASLGPLLPEFLVCAEAEPDEGIAKAISKKELEHVLQLLATYEAETAAVGRDAGDSSAGGGSSSNSRPQPPEGEGEEGSWAGEGYEKAELRGVEKGYLKFSKRLARQPHQCARYCLNGPLLWPKSSLPHPAPCPRCGEPRVFELQLMPALIQLTIEAAQMALEQGMPADAAVVDAVANWDWVTLAVFTCQASCSHSQVGDTCEVFVEEVALINEQDCHIALPPPVPALAAAQAGGNLTSADVPYEGENVSYDDDTDN